jgi:hypothetical protein
MHSQPLNILLKLIDFFLKFLIECLAKLISKSSLLLYNPFFPLFLIFLHPVPMSRSNGMMDHY